jgi:hypothetical protein
MRRNSVIAKIRHLDPPGRRRSFAHLQALDDAIDYRRARLAISCHDCRPTTRCDDHACDVSLLGKYRRMRRAAVAELESAGRGSAPTTPGPQVKSEVDDGATRMPPNRR